jgi:protein SCO1/2
MKKGGASTMATRRAVLAGLATGAAASVGRLTTAFPSQEDLSGADCQRPLDEPYADYFPNVVVQTHENQRALFYDDLLQGKVVLINCMSINYDGVYPVTANLVQVQRLLGDRVGRDVFMYSLTVDPENDTPGALKAFAERHGVQPGWLFLTGTRDVIEALHGRLFAHGDGHAQDHGSFRDGSMGLVRYGNVALGLWGSVPTKTSPEWIVERLSWVVPRQRLTGTPKRRGPAVMAWAQPGPQRLG